MGLFSQTPAEKKLERLTGGAVLSDEFKALLRANNIDLHTGEEIKKQLKEEIKLDIVSAEGLETRIRYLIKKHANTAVNDDSSSNETPQQPRDLSLRAYEKQINQLKQEYDTKEKNVKGLIEKRFAPPQITYDKFMSSIDNCNKVFNSQYQSAINIVQLASHDTPKIDMELEHKIGVLKDIIKFIDDLTGELLINLNSKSNDDVDTLSDDMQNLIDSVKDYDI